MRSFPVITSTAEIFPVIDLFVIILRSVGVILSCILIRSGLFIRCFVIMIPEYRNTVIWRKYWRIIEGKSTIEVGMAEPF